MCVYSLIDKHIDAIIPRAVVFAFVSALRVYVQERRDEAATSPTHQYCKLPISQAFVLVDRLN
jgi:hypothetical protein